MAVRRVFLCSFGFDERFIVRCLVRHGFGEGDTLKLITAEPLENRVVDAYRRVEELVRRLGGRVELTALDYSNLDTALSKILQIFHSENRKFIVNLSGGMRILTCLTLIALITVEREINVKLEIETEDLRKLIEIPREILALPKFRFSKAKSKIAETLLLTGETSISQLSTMIGKDKSLVSRHLKDMGNVGLVEITRRGRIKLVKPTSILEALTERCI